MGLGTIDTVSSIALAMVPPGNVARSISEIRKSIWKEYGEPSARAYFDYPVLAWLGSPLDGAYLAGISSRLDLPFELSGLGLTGADAFLCFSEDGAGARARVREGMPLATDASEFAPGPFPADVGCFCARFGGGAAPSSLVGIEVPPVRAKTYLLAQIELRWVRDPSLASSWATLSSARCGKTRAGA
ncbi:MAG: hypothetical protein KKA67_13665 [Spirochaetes bacterium]|nr:hypothetical protein [Spirochaetota bacterium]